MSQKSPPGASAAVACVWDRFRGVILGRVNLLERAAQAAGEGRLTEELRQAARLEAHKLAGAAGIFGYARGTELALAIEQLLDDRFCRTLADCAVLGRLTHNLRQELQATPPPG